MKALIAIATAAGLLFGTPVFAADASAPAKELGIRIGMTGREAVELLLAASKSP